MVLVPIVAKLLVELGRTEEATQIYWELLDRNPANWESYHGLEDSIKPGQLNQFHYW